MQRRCEVVRVLALALIAWLMATVAQATTYYTATTGSDSVSCIEAQNISTPKRSIRNGVMCLHAGDTLYVRGGTYGGGADRISGADFVASGTGWDNAITIAGYPSETVTVKNDNYNLIVFDGSLGVALSYIVIQNMIFDGALFSSDRAVVNLDPPHHHIRLDTVTLRNSPGHMALVAGDYMELLNSVVENTHQNGALPTREGNGWYGGGSFHVVDGNEFRNLGAGCVRFFTSDLTHLVTGSIARNNTCHDFSGGGALVGAGFILGGTNLLAYNNVVYSNTQPSQAFQVQYGQSNSNVQVLNNTVYGVYQGIDIEPGSSSTPTGTVVKNNIVYLSSNADIVDHGSGTIFATNWTTSSGNPNFVNVGTSDFHLQAGSGAIDAGTTIATITSDKDGVARPKGSAYDRGAYEYCTVACGAVPTGPAAPRNPRLTAATANAETTAVCALLGSGFFDLYTGAQPATADTALTTQTRLASVPIDASPCGAPSSGIASLLTTASVTATASGTATFFRVWKSDHTTPVFDGSIGTSNADLVLRPVALLSSGRSFTLSAFTITSSLQGLSALGGAHVPRLTNLAANAKANAVCALLNSGFLDIYEGDQPATANTAIGSQTKLASLAFSATACGAAVAGVATANAITSDTDADATGTANFFRAWKSDHTTPVLDGTIGTSGADLNLTSTAITIHGTVPVTTFTITASKGS